MPPEGITRSFGQQYRNVPGVLIQRARIPNRNLSSVRMKFTNEAAEKAYPHLTRDNSFLIDNLDL